MNYSRNEILKGVQRTKELEETDQTFENQDALAGKTRMAGDVGARALRLMSDPQAQQATTNWMQQFKESNEGLAFDQGKIQKAMMGLG